MHVIKRDGRHVPLRFDEITDRLKPLCKGLNVTAVIPEKLTMMVAQELKSGMRTYEIDELVADKAAALITDHSDWGIFCARLLISNLHLQTKESFYEVMKMCHDYTDPKSRKHAPLVRIDIFQWIHEHKDALQAEIKWERDDTLDLFGYRTLEKAYLHRINGHIVERPQHMYMRVACEVGYKQGLAAVIQSYHAFSTKLCTMATPTLMNAARRQPGLASCFLLAMPDDSIEGIAESWRQCALISKGGGGIGKSISNIRASGSYIRGTAGQSTGLIPMLGVDAKIASYVDQGGGKRKGSIATYLEPWHADFMDWVEHRRPNGNPERRHLNLFHGVWCNDLFMHRVKEGKQWSFFCPDQAPGLCDVWGHEFDQLYERYEKEGRAVKQLPAQEVWRVLVEVMCETGQPYMCFKDACNGKSNQQHLGTIRSSNLCSEIVEYSSKDEIAVCNLGSMGLPMFLKPKAVEAAVARIRKYQELFHASDGVHSKSEKVPDLKAEDCFDFEKFGHTVRLMVRNLNAVIDQMHYPVEACKTSNLKHRPIGLGLQGLANVFASLRIPFTSPKARELNVMIAETMYYHAMDESVNMARDCEKPGTKYSGAYESFVGSPLSRGQFQFDLWKVQPSSRYDWNTLREKVLAHGARNSLMIAIMPTATTSQIVGNQESIEPFTSNLYIRKTLHGEFTCINPYLIDDLIMLGLWNKDLKQRILACGGSIQSIESIPVMLREVYRTVGEIDPYELADMFAERGPYVCQSQSANYFGPVKPQEVTNYLFYMWEKGAKTGTYYLRSDAPVEAQKVTLDPHLENKWKSMTPLGPRASTPGAVAAAVVPPAPSSLHREVTLIPPVAPGVCPRNKRKTQGAIPNEPCEACSA